MENFNFYYPTSVYFGKGSIEKLPKALNDIKKNASILMVYGGGSIKRLGIYDKILELCASNGNSITEMSGIEPNPRLNRVIEGIEIAKKENIDIVMGVGGGSAIDTAKAIAYLRYADTDPWQTICDRKIPVEKAMPVVAIPTLAATGTETDPYAVISNPEVNGKMGIGSDIVRPKAAIMDPTYTFSVSKYHTGAGTADILSHCFECYFSVAKGCYLQKRVCEAVIKTVIKYGPIALNDPENYEARSNLMWAASMAISGETARGAINTGWSCHPIEHVISGYYDITHGAGLAAITPTWMRYILSDETVDDFAAYGVNVWGIEESNDKYAMANKAIDLTEQFFISLGMPVNLKDAGIPDESQIEAMAKSVGKVSGYVKLDEQDIQNILKKAF